MNGGGWKLSMANNRAMDARLRSPPLNNSSESSASRKATPPNCPSYSVSLMYITPTSCSTCLKHPQESAAGSLLADDPSRFNGGAMPVDGPDGAAACAMARGAPCAAGQPGWRPHAADVADVLNKAGPLAHTRGGRQSPLPRSGKRVERRPGR
eukprot:CAMPEP_0170234190 /NCGR_PEP_ID=MMETSP0116_2-20130129/16841_1 /TAXON_ID=400756 /ORGANISM="Durinskia baltica, Strain CSIRO CS-38" /LENGTH=152 /DNA_ID=CAMNT_0010484985 /DNA_START=135 /DNA_END=590 /DNA_ORIENTATION=+